MTQEYDAPVASADDHKFTLRIPGNIHAELEAACTREARSLNSEILLRLQRTVAQDTESKEQAARTHLGLIEFLAGCVQELEGMLPDEQRKDTKVQLMVELTRQLTRSR